VTSYLVEPFNDEERALLAQHFSTVQGQVFSLINLEEEVKAALFARYSRSAKSLRRVFLDEFADGSHTGRVVGSRHATELINRVIGEYGDDSVAQLGVIHLGVEQVSTYLTRVIERGRLMAYLEKSTRYVSVADRRQDGSDQVVVPRELDGTLRESYLSLSRELISIYERVRAAALAELQRHVKDDSSGAQSRALRAAALDAARMILPVGTMTNVGIVANAQSLEYLILRLRAQEDAETREVAELLSQEARRHFPALTGRLNRTDRGGATTAYLETTRFAARREVRMETSESPGFCPQDIEVRLVDFDPGGDDEVLCWIAFECGVGSIDSVRKWVGGLDASSRDSLFGAYVGERSNRRLRPGRAFEMVNYTFEVVCDFASLRDLGRHRLLTIMSQDFGPEEGFVSDPMWATVGLEEVVYQAFARAVVLYRQIEGVYGAGVARLILPLAFRSRNVFKVNARELMHLCELRSQPQGHPGYRRIAIEMYRAIDQIPAHKLIASSFLHVDSGYYEAGRIGAERRSRP